MEGEGQQVLRVVGFGASAGGLQALRPIVRGLKPGGDKAFVVAHHLSPTQETHLAGLLASASRMPVVAVRHGEPILPDHIYVVPPGHDLELHGHTLALMPKDASTFISPSVDRLFRSLAAAYGEGAIAVVLSGSGSDGAAGAEEVKKAGGVVIAQSPEETLQSGMPEAVIDTGCADYVGTTEQIVDWLNGPELMVLPRRGPSGDQALGTFAELFQLVGQASGIDLGRYKDSTLRRQATRRYRALGIASLGEYLEHVRKHSDELLQLQQCFLISVSSFFRDAAAFAALEAALRPQVARKGPEDALRAWIPGCATGEEAYSVAMLMAEVLGDRLDDLEVRIFASDIDQPALEYARAGFYSDAEVASVGAARRARWFTREGAGWRIGQAIRERCVFARHDVTAHPPFIKLDVVSCRNLLIYFTSPQQAELLHTFHYALNPEGILLLGKSESTGFQTPGFEPLDSANKLYRRRPVASGHHARYSRLTLPFTVSPTPMMPPSSTSSQRQQLVTAAQRTLAREYGPPGVLVNARFEPLHFFGRSQRFFALPEGSADFTAFALCLPELRSELKAMCYRVVQDKLACLEGLTVDLAVEGEPLRVKPTLRRVELGEGSGEAGFLLIFEEQARVRRADSPAGGAEAMASEDVQRLHKELADTREQLQAVIDKLEASSEDQQSMQEELQSSSEELQASNEELQASNEELTTVNEELRLKSLESAQLSVTLSNIQNSVRTSLVVVDPEGRITRYNDLATRIFGLVSKDLGQFLYGVPSHVSLPRLRAQVGGVITTGESLLERVHDGDFHYLMRIDPYLNEAGETAGAVLTFSDFSELYQAEEARRSSEIRFRRVWEASMEGMVVSDEGGTIVLANPAMEEMFGYAPGELLGRSIDILVPEDYRPAHPGRRQSFLSQGDQTRTLLAREDLAGVRKDGVEVPVEISLSGFELDGRRHVLASVADVTTARQATAALRASEARLRQFVDHLPAAVAMFDRDMRYLAVSRRWLDDYQLGDRGELLGRSYYDIFPEIPEAWREVHRRGLAGEVVRAEEDRFYRTDGTTQWLRWEVRPWQTAAGAVGGILLFTEDITERKQAAERKLRNSFLERELDVLQGVLESTLAGYWDWNIATGSEYLSPTFKRMFGYADEELPNSPEVWQRLIFQEDLPGVLETFDRHVRSHGREPFYNEVRYRHKSGATVWVICAGRVVEWADDGGPVRMVGCQIDVTPLHDKVEELVEANLRADSANRAKGVFLANMSHEIRTPLNAIQGMAHVLGRRLDNPEHLDMVRKISVAASHLLAVISDILDLSRIEADKLALNHAEFDLAEVVANVRAMEADRASAKGLELVVECEPLGYRVLGDGTRYTQALLNLVSNAVKFTQSGEVRIRLERLGEANGRVHLRAVVQDTGPGIAPTMLQRLFQPFEQGDAPLARSAGGSGLGLTITKRLAQLMGGDAGATSEVGRGSTFWFTAWLAICAESTDHGPSAAGGDRALAVLQREFAGARVLLAEDEAVNREVASLNLEDAGLEIVVANDGVEAVDQARRQDFDLVLMDMQMPRMGGLEATREIRRLPGWARRPIIAMTANAFAEDRQHCLEAGMNDFLSKPVDPDKFFDTVLYWLTVGRDQNEPQ